MGGVPFRVIAVSTEVEVNRMIAAAINVDPRWFWEGSDA
jgi:hypothetical protein